MKKITSNIVYFLFFLIGINFSFGQTVIYNLSGGGALPTGWTSVNNNTTQPIDKGSYYLVETATPADEITTNTNDLSAFASADLEVTISSFGGGTHRELKIEVSYDGGTTYTDTFLTPVTTGTYTLYTFTLSTVSNQVVVRYSNNGATGRGIRMQGVKLTASGVSGPTITATPTTLTNFFYIEGTTPTQEQSFTVEGALLTNDITITPPTDFEISLTSGAGFVATPIITLSHTGGTVASQSIFVRQITGLLTANSPFSGNIACASTGATTVDVAVDGKVGLYYPCSNATGATIAAESFEGLGDWTYTASPLPYDEASHSDVWAIATVVGNGGGVLDTASDGTKFWGIRDLNNSGSGGGAYHKLTFDTIDISNISNLVLTFDYYTNGFDGNDEMKYTVIYDNLTNWPNASAIPLNKNTDSWTTVTIPVPAGSNFIRLQLKAKQDGGIDWGGFDNIKLTGDTFASTTWNGSTWSNLAPNQTTKAIFSGNYNTATDGGDINTCECEVKNGAILTIAPTNFLNIESDIVIGSAAGEGTIVVENTGSIVQSNKDAVINGTNFQIQKTTPSYISYDYTYWSSPIENATLSIVLNNSPQNYIFSLDASVYSDEFDDNTYPQTTGTGDTHDDNNDSWAATTGAMAVGSGYIAMGEGSAFPFVPPTPADTHTQSVSFDGKINNGIINVNVFEDLYNVTNGIGDSFNTNANLIGNPYPSAIDINKLMANNAGVLQGTFYFWTHDSSINSANPGPNAYEFTNADYAIGTSDGITFLPVSAGSAGTTAPQFIASGQGFLANAKNNGIVTFNNSMRETGNNTFFRNAEDLEIDKIWLNLTDDNGFYRQILVAFSSNGSDGFTNGQDAMRLETGLEGDFYSIMQNEPNNKYAIQTLATLNDEKIIPLGIKLYNTNNYAISIDHLEGDLENTNIYLKDNLFNTITDLKLSDYTFDTPIGQIDNRFELMFSRDALSTDTVSIQNTDLVISNSNNEIHIEMLNQENITNIKAFDIIGKLVLQTNTNNSSIDLNTNIKNGTVLIFKVILANGQTLTKKFIKF